MRCQVRDRTADMSVLTDLARGLPAYADLREKLRGGETRLTLAGGVGAVGSADGTGAVARFNFPNGVAVDSSDNLFVADSANHTLRKITPGGVVTTVGGLAGTAGSADGTGAAALFNSPYDVTVDGAGNLYVVDSYNNITRRGFPTASLSPVLLQSPRIAGEFGFGITGTSNLTVDIQTSSDLVNWQPISTYALVAGTNYFLERLLTETNRLFRATVR